jgi:hypothetical protein
MRRLSVIGSISSCSASEAWLSGSWLRSSVRATEDAPLRAGQAERLGALIDLPAQEPTDIVHQKAQPFGRGECGLHASYIISKLIICKLAKLNRNRW